MLKTWLIRSACLLSSLGVMYIAPATAQFTPPVVTSISPASVTAGAPSFTLTVNGSGFLTSSTVQVNGSNRPTVFKSALQLTATVFASDIPTPTTLSVTVFNAVVGGGGGISNTVPLTVSTAPAPVLTSVFPEFVSQGADHVRMTLQGENFRSGATVVISPPLSGVAASNGHTRATDVLMLSATVLSSGTMTAIFNVSPGAVLGLRAVDILNLDGTSTAGSTIATAFVPGTSQPLRVESSNSLGAPLSVLNMALLSPRDGTVVVEGDELNAQAILAGSGTGTVIGQWLWDGNVVEQFSASIVGGQSTAIRTRQSLPTWLLGLHTLQLRMVQPNQIATKPIIVVVNPGTWQVQQLIWPEYGSAFPSDAPPRLLWAPVPGAMKYQVGFSDRPYLATIRTWYDVVDNSWEVPERTWQALSEGQLYWTVRAIEPSGTPRKPLPMRSIYRAPADGLTPLNPVPGRTPAGNTLLEWKPALPFAFYYVVISSDEDGEHPVRQYLTTNPNVDLRALDRQLVPGTTYYWRVNALTPSGTLFMPGQPHSFVAQIVPRASAGFRNLPQLASLAVPDSLADPDLTSEIAERTPPPDSNINDPKPTISASFSTPVNPADVSLMVDDVDITSLAQVTESQVAFTPPLALASGDHTVNLSVANEAASWKFSEAAAAPAAQPPSTVGPAVQPGTDAEAPPAIAGVWPGPTETNTLRSVPKPPKAGAPPPAQMSAPIEQGQISSNTQWSSGSNPPDTNAFSVAERIMYDDQIWKVEFNGSGLLNSTLNPEIQRTSQGHVNDYVLQLGYQGDAWGANLRFGIVSPVLYTDAQFVTAATPRQGAEFTLTTPAGKFGYFVNTNDEALGGGAGINFHQQLMGASWEAPLPKWAQFRLMWLSAQDTGAPTTTSFDSLGNPIILPNPIAPKSMGDVYGALLNIHLTPKWLLSSEYAFSRDNPDVEVSGSKAEFGRAWRTGISGEAGQTHVSVSYRDIGPNFGNPANPSLTQFSQPNLRGVDSAITQTTSAGTFGVDYQFLQNNVHPTTSAELDLNSFDETWSKQFGVKTNVVVDARQSLTGTVTVPASLQGQTPDQTGAQDLRDISGTVNLSRQIGTVTVSGGGTRDWNRNSYFPTANTITSSINFGANLITRTVFQLNSQFDVNWVAANGLSVGTTRNITLYMQPAFVWQKSGLQVFPLITLLKGRTILATGTLTNDSLTGQYGGRVAWTLPGVLKFNTFSMQGTYNQNRNSIMSIDQRSTELFGLWTVTWGHKHTL